jgi:glycosyltransferase involved in cell wall biosynthesis
VELVVVDNFSTDETWRVAQELADVAIQAGPERSAQRNLGIDRSSGEWVMWIDGDMILPPSILERAMEAVQNADGVFIPEITVGTGYWTCCRALERSCCTEELLVQSPRLVKRQYMTSTGGFLTSLSGTEDAELRTRMLEDGRTLTWIPDLIVHDEGRMTLGGVLRKRYYYGRGLASYKQDHPGALSGQAKAAIGAYGRNWRRLAAQPSIAVGAVFMRGLEAGAYGLGAFVGSRRPGGGPAA